MVALEYKRICRNCWKVIPEGKLSYTGAIFIKNEWWCCIMCEKCYQVKYPIDYKFLKDDLTKQRKKKRLSVLYPLSRGRKI